MQWLATLVSLLHLIAQKIEEYSRMGRYYRGEAAVAAVDSPPGLLLCAWRDSSHAVTRVIPTDRTTTGRQARVPSWQAEATVRISALPMRLADVCHDTADTQRV